jgi:hypothetical protein
MSRVLAHARESKSGKQQQQQLLLKQRLETCSSRQAASKMRQQQVQNMPGMSRAMPGDL